MLKLFRKILNYLSPETETYELWNDKDTQVFLPANHKQKSWLTERHEKIWEVRAISWVDANEKYYKHMGWGPYKKAD